MVEKKLSSEASLQRQLLNSLGPLGSLEEEIRLKSFACIIHYCVWYWQIFFNLLNNSQSLIVWSEVLHKLCVLQCLGYGILVPSLQDIAGACIIFSNLVCIQSSIHIGWLTFDSFCVTISLMFLSLFSDEWSPVCHCHACWWSRLMCSISLEMKFIFLFPVNTIIKVDIVRLLNRG